MPMYPHSEEFDRDLPVHHGVGTAFWRVHAIDFMAAIIGEVGGLHDEKATEVSRALLEVMDKEWGWLDEMYLGELAQQIVHKVAQK